MMPGRQRYPGCQDNFAESADAVNKMTDMDACRAIDGVRSQTARHKIAIWKYLIYYLLWQYWLC